MNLKSVSILAAAATACVLSAPASALTYNFVAALNGIGDGVSTTATGSAYVTFDDVAHSVTVTEIFIGLTGGPATAGHIHCCTTTPGTGTAGVVVPFTGFPSAVSGLYTATLTTFQTLTFAQILAGAQAGDAYVNIHNAAHPGGEISGFLQAVAVPEPGTYALMLAGLGAVGWVARKRRQG